MWGVLDLVAVLPCCEMRAHWCCPGWPLRRQQPHLTWAYSHGHCLVRGVRHLLRPGNSNKLLLFVCIPCDVAVFRSTYLAGRGLFVVFPVCYGGCFVDVCGGEGSDPGFARGMNVIACLCVFI